MNLPLVLLLVACSAGPSPALPAGPSVLLVTLDTTRADRLGPYGHRLAETPTLDRLAASGTTWLRAYAASPLTIPSHSTILPGRHPPSHGVRDNGDFVLGPQAITLAERFHDAGYRTAAFTSAFPTQRRWGFDQGFEIYRDPLERLPTQLDWRDQRRADEVVDEALAVLSPLDGPLFVWVHLFDPHWPYDPPEPYRSRHLGRPYDGEIAFADAQLGRLLAWWDEAHPDGVVLVTADHGEGLGEGGEETHGYLLHDATMRVPLLARGPGLAEGRRVRDPVGLVDVAPTLLALAGLRVHAEVQGRDLRDGGSGEIYAEALTGRYSLGLAPLYSLTDARGRYIEGSWGAYHRADGDVVSTAATPDADLEVEARRLATMRAALDEVIAPSAALDPESLGLLEALGYLGGHRGVEAGELDPRDVIDLVPLTWRAQQAIAEGDLEEASALVAVLEDRMQGAFGVDLLRAHIVRGAGHTDEAAERYADLFLRAPSGTLALQLGAIEAAHGAWDEALSWYHEALALQPWSPEAMAGLVRTYQALGEVEAAAELADAFLGVYPDHAELAVARAEIHLATLAPERARTEAREAVERLPWSPWARAVLAGALWELGEADAALEQLQEALRLDPFDLSVRLQLAACLLDVQRRAEAVRTLTPIARLLPDDDAVQGLYAEALEGLAAQRGR